MPDTDPCCPVCREVGGPHGVPAAPDRPGDRDQQQAVEYVDSLAAWLVAHYGSLLRPPNDMGDGKSDAKRLVAYLHQTGVVAAARAEEAARWQAQIDAMIRQAQAEALNEAARIVAATRGIKYHGSAVRELCDRAAALRLTTDQRGSMQDAPTTPPAPR